MRTHCRKGHELTEENVYIEKSGYRRCVQCRGAEASAWQKTDYQNDPQKYLERGRGQERRPEVKTRRKVFYEKNKSATWRKYSVLKSIAKQFGRDCTLTQEDYNSLVSDNSCHYCSGCLPEVGYGIDRQDNRMGYVHGNVVACCERCNEHKGSLERIGFRYPRTVELLMELINHANTSLDSQARGG